MREKKRLLAVVVALSTALAIPSAVNAHTNPQTCTGSSPTVRFADEVLNQLQTPVREGDEIVLAADIYNRGASACDLSEIMVTVRLPEVDGASEEFLLIHNVKLSAGATVTAVNHNPYVVDLDEDAFQGPLEIFWSATMHNGTEDSQISGEGAATKLNLTRPRATLTVDQDKASGEPPLTVNYTYELTNTSPDMPAGLAAPRLIPGGLGEIQNAITDANCEPVEHQLPNPPVLFDAELDPMEKWTFTCSRTFTLPGTYTSQPSINASSSADGRPWPQVPTGGAQVTVLGADLTVEKTHSGDLLAGGNGQYLIRVTNTGNQQTSGEVSLADQLPAGLTATAISGEGWSCSLRTLTCSRSDSLAIGSSYPDVTLAVKVANDPPDNVVNTATVSGGGEPTAAAANNLAEDPTSIRKPGQPEPPVGSRFRIKQVKASADGSATIKVLVPGAGRLTLDDAKKPDLLRRSSRKVGKSKVYAVVVKAGPKLRQQLTRSGKPQRVRVKVTFISPGSVSTLVAFRSVQFSLG